MARFSSLVAIALTSSTALAQPVTSPSHAPCAVTIAVAPDDARREIEAWVRAEPRCERQLEVRVVPTEDGLYLSARDAEGRVRERIVPDAQAAAVLVVSWMADDSLGPDLPTPIEVSAPPPPSAAAARAEVDEAPVPQATIAKAPGDSMVVDTLAVPAQLRISPGHARSTVSTFERRSASALPPRVMTVTAARVCRATTTTAARSRRR